MEALIKKYAKEFLSMKRGDKIANPQEIIWVSRAAKFTRRSLKHFIESRFAQGNSWDEIDYLLKKVKEISETPQLEMRNPNQHNYPNSFLLASLCEDNRKAVIMILDKGEIPRDIVALYFTKRSNFFKLLNGEKEAK